MVEQERGDLPEELPDGERLHARSVWLSAPDLGVSARIDLIEGDRDEVMPVDYKRGSPPTAIPAPGLHRVQLCAQGLVLQANGYRSTGGVVYYTATKTRVHVVFDEELISQTRAAVQGLRRLAEAAPHTGPAGGEPQVRPMLAGADLSSR